MNNQDFFNLQEAYLGVYQRETVEPDPFGRPGGKYGGVPAPGSGYDRAWKAIQKKNKEEKNKKNTKEQVDLYDIILSHLLDEGYAETLQGAEAIMVNMSEEWRESIVEARHEKHEISKLPDNLKSNPNLSKTIKRAFRSLRNVPTQPTDRQRKLGHKLSALRDRRESDMEATGSRRGPESPTDR